MINDYIYIFLWYVITHPGPQLIEMGTWTSSYTTLTYMDVINDPRPNPDASLTNLLLKAALEEKSHASFMHITSASVIPLMS